MARLDPASGPLYPAGWGTPLFALGSDIYPVDPEFDWSEDSDVLTDAIRHTHLAIRLHGYAKHADDRSWFACDCVDLDAHIGLLSMGLSLLYGQLLRLHPEAPRAESFRRRAPVAVGTFLRSVHVFVLAAIGYSLMELLPI